MSTGKHKAKAAAICIEKTRVLTVKSNRWETYFGICILLTPMQFVCTFSLNLIVPTKQSVVLDYLFGAICVYFFFESASTNDADCCSGLPIWCCRSLLLVEHDCAICARLPMGMIML